MEDFRNEYCMHTATCGQLRATDVNQEVTLCGWAWHTRDHGGLIFIDLRDRDGYTQVVVDPDCVSEEDFHAAEHLGREYVLKVSGRVRERAPEAINPNMITGEIEVLANAVEVLNTSVTPPFSIEDGIETDEITRMKWRYLDIRRPEMLANLKLRHTVTQAMRRALDERGFLDNEREQSLSGAGAAAGRIADQRRFPHQCRRICRGRAGGGKFGAVRCERQPDTRPGGPLADGIRLYPKLLYGVLPGRTDGRPLYEPVQERADPELLPSQRPDDLEGIPDGLRRPGDKSHRGEADSGGDRFDSERKSAGDREKKSG